MAEQGLTSAHPETPSSPPLVGGDKGEGEK